MLTVPKHGQDLTAAWLTAALQAGGQVKDATVRSVGCETFGEGFGVVGELTRLTLEGGEPHRPLPRTMVAKRPAPRAEARQIAADYGFYEREVRFYQRIAPTISLRTPLCYFAEFDSASGDFIILLEDLAPAKSADQLGGMPIEQVGMAISSVAELHARWWSRPELDALTIFPVVNEAPYDRVQANHCSALPAAERFFASRFSKALQRAAERLSSRLSSLQDALAKPPRTIVHADFRADNLMFLHDAQGTKMTVVDWAVTFQARGTFDVGYLMGGHVSTALRRAQEMTLLRMYHARLIALGVRDYDFDECLIDYRRAVLFGVTYLVQTVAFSDLAHSRTLALMESWGQRLDAAIQDLGLAELLD